MTLVQSTNGASVTVNTVGCYLKYVSDHDGAPVRHQAKEAV